MTGRRWKIRKITQRENKNVFRDFLWWPKKKKTIKKRKIAMLSSGINPFTPTPQCRSNSCCGGGIEDRQAPCPNFPLSHFSDIATPNKKTSLTYRKERKTKWRKNPLFALNKAGRKPKKRSPPPPPSLQENYRNKVRPRGSDGKRAPPS